MEEPKRPEASITQTVFEVWLKEAAVAIFFNFAREKRRNEQGKMKKKYASI